MNDVHVRRGPDINSDHYLVTAPIRLKLKKNSQTTNRPKIDIGKLKTQEIRTKFNLELKNRFAALHTLEDTSSDPETSLLEKKMARHCHSIHRNQQESPWSTKENNKEMADYQNLGFDR